MPLILPIQGLKNKMFVYPFKGYFIFLSEGCKFNLHPIIFTHEKRAVAQLLIKDLLFILWRIALALKLSSWCFTCIYINIYYNICQVSNFVNLLFITLSILSICSGNNFNLTNFPLTLELNLRLLTDRIKDIQA